MKKLAIILSLALAACEPSTPQEAAMSRDYSAGKPVLVSEHDGVRIWKVRDHTPGGATYVYFTTLGEVRYPVSCGKNCTRQEHTGPVR